MVSIGWTSSGGHGPLLADGRVARVGQHVAAVGGFDPATLKQRSQHFAPCAAAQRVRRDRSPIRTAGGSAQQLALTRGEFG